MKRILLFVVALLVILIAVAFVLPRHIELERSITIDAPPHTVYTVLNGYTLFNEWSPWAEDDDAAVYEYSGPREGVGAKMSWKSEALGDGSQEIVVSEPGSKIGTQMDFGDQGQPTAQFQLTPEGEGTKVVWGFKGDMGMNPVARYMGLFIGRMLGPDYEEGLQSLKTLVEGLPDDDFSDLEGEVMMVTSVPLAYVEKTTTLDPDAITASMGEGLGELMAGMEAHGLTPAGPHMAIHQEWDEEQNVYRYHSAFALPAAPEEGSLGEDAQLSIGSSYEGQAIKTVYTGPYSGSEPVYGQLMALAAARGYTVAGVPWDVYMNHPDEVPEDALITEIYLPVEG